MPLQYYLRILSEWFSSHIWVLMLICGLLGFLLGVSILAARFNSIKGYIKLVQYSSVEELSSKWLGVKIICKKIYANNTAIQSRALNIPPPALRSNGVLLSPEQVLVTQPNELIYYLPENANTPGAKGIAFPSKVRLVYGNPPIPELTGILPVVPVLAPASGIWLSTKVGPQNITVDILDKRYRGKHSRLLRNLYILDYVEKDDLLGYIQPVEKKSKPVSVFAPVSGYILQFGALEKTSIAKGASVMLLARVNSVIIKSEHVGTFFTHENNQPLFQLGQIVKAGTTIGYLTHLRNIRHDIKAPCDLVLLRCFVYSDQSELGTPVGFADDLFSYRAINKPLV